MESREAVLGSVAHQSQAKPDKYSKKEYAGLFEERLCELLRNSVSPPGHRVGQVQQTN